MTLLGWGAIPSETSFIAYIQHSISILVVAVCVRLQSFGTEYFAMDQKGSFIITSLGPMHQLHEYHLQNIPFVATLATVICMS